MTSAPPPALRLRIGPYELQSQLGKGGMAEVYRARVTTGPREGWTVAVKRLLPALAQDRESVALFAKEAALTQVLDHPNIVKVLEVGVLDGESFIVMELVDGRDLGHILKRCKHRGIPLPVDFALYLAKVLLEALAYAHSATGAQGQPLGIVHCDVSPSNLFISRVGEIKLGDFGVAKVRAGSGVRQAEVLGKPYYVSPEAIRGEVSAATDLWAATVVLYELLTLHRPFSGETPEQVFEAIHTGRYVPVCQVRPELPGALDALIAKAFSPDPRQRFATATAFAQSLGPLLDERVGTPLAIAAVVRGLFGTSDA